MLRNLHKKMVFDHSTTPGQGVFGYALSVGKNRPQPRTHMRRVARAGHKASTPAPRNVSSSHGTDTLPLRWSRRGAPATHRPGTGLRLLSHRFRRAWYRPPKAGPLGRSRTRALCPVVAGLVDAAARCRGRRRFSPSPAVGFVRCRSVVRHRLRLHSVFFLSFTCLSRAARRHGVAAGGVQLP